MRLHVSPAALLVALGLGGLACHRSPAPPVAAAAWSDDSAEAIAISAAHGRVHRVGLDLVFRALNGSVTQLRDDTLEGDNFVYYYYAGAVPRTRFHGVHVQYYESREYLLLDDSTGYKTALIAEPVVSPHGVRLVTALFDLESGEEPNGMVIAHPVADSVVVDWKVFPNNWGPDSVAWHGNDSLFVRQGWADTLPTGYTYRNKWLVRHGTRWIWTP
jgi:hypothetical protein